MCDKQAEAARSIPGDWGVSALRAGQATDAAAINRAPTPESQKLEAEINYHVESLRKIINTLPLSSPATNCYGALAEIKSVIIRNLAR